MNNNPALTAPVWMLSTCVWAGVGMAGLSISAASARPDLTDLHLSGFGMERDSVAVALAAAAKHLGREADYERVYLLSGNAFAPAIATNESCRSWWHVQAHAGTGNLPALATALGLRAEPLVLPARPAADDPALAAWFAKIGARITEAMGSGAVVLTEGGWDEPGGWNWAGIVTEVGTDGVIRGAALSAVTGDGKEGVVWRHPSALWAIRPGSVPTPAAEVDRATLRLAVERIRGTGACAPREGLLFGLPAVDHWIATLKTDRGFCADCFGRKAVPGVHDAPDNDRRMRAAAQVLERQLRSGFPSLPPEARRPLDQAANCYQRIAKSLGEALDTPGFYDRLNSLEAQGAYAQRQLWWVRGELAAAAGRFEEALRLVEGRPPDLRLAVDEGTRMLTLEGLQSVTHAENAHWFGAAPRFAVKQLGIEVDYHTLMGDLGTAFILQASDQAPLIQGALDAGWWPLEPAGLHLFLDFAGRVHGFQSEVANLGSSEEEAARAYRERYQQRIEAELRARRPCLGFLPCLNVITGLNPETGALLRVCPGTTTMPDFWETDPAARPWELIFLSPRSGPLIPRAEADRQALRNALTLMRDEVPMSSGYRSGAKAFAIWAAALRDREHLGHHYWHGNVVNILGQSRRSAVVYLQAMAARWPEAVAAHLRAACGHYQAVLAACGQADTSEAALTKPGDGRERLALLVERMAGLEVEAATELDLALTAMGDAPASDPARLVLAGVPPVSFPGGARKDGAPQMTCFPACLGAVLRFLKEDFGTVEVDSRPLPSVHPLSPGDASMTLDRSYVLLMGASGAAFRLSWAPDWVGNGSDLRWMSDDPWAPYRKAFEAAGRAFEVVEKHDSRDDERFFRQRIVASIRRGVPVIARGVIGPPEPCLVTGYGESGATLVGWNFWQGDANENAGVSFETDGSFRKRDWFKNTDSLLVIGERTERPLPRDLHRAALGWALQVMRTPVTHTTRANGIAAFDAWAEALQRDAEFEGQDLAALKQRFTAHLVATDVIAEGRWYAHNYLKTAALDLPDVKEPLRQAAELCRGEHDLVWEMWRVGGSWGQMNDEKAVRTFATTATRRQLADLVIKLRDADREVADLIAKALGRLEPKREGDRVAIAGLEREFWGGKSNRQNSTLACLALVLQRLGEDVSYEDVMGLSAAAFRFQVHKDGMCPSSPHACCGYDCYEHARRALGVKEDGILTDAKHEPDRARARQAVVDSIDRGIPAFCASEECSLLVGYEKGGETLLGRWYSTDKEGYEPMKDWPWGVIVLSREAAPDRREALLRALRTAVELAKTEENQGKERAYPSGFRAFRLWAGWLRDQERMTRETTDDKRFGTALGNAFILDCLIDARQAAAIFLRTNAKCLGPDADAALLKAAKHYDEVIVQARAISPLAPWPWNITPEKPWTLEMMQQQADRVEGLIPIEQAAIAEIEQALRFARP